jgi:hypothetical protein
MKRVLLTLPFIALAPMAQAEGLDFSGNVSMGLQATTIHGETEVAPIARLEGGVTYTMQTDVGVTFVLALEFDETLGDTLGGTNHMEFRPGHR